MSKLKTISLVFAIIFYGLGIAQRLWDFGILSQVYPIVSQTHVFYLLLIFGTVFLALYIIERLRKRVRGPFAFTIRRRPSSIDMLNPRIRHDFGVNWRVYPPSPLERDRRPWADGPYCPNCDRELEEETEGRIFKKSVWACPTCNREYDRPKGEVKEAVEKNFAAYLRRQGRV